MASRGRQKANLRSLSKTTLSFEERGALIDALQDSSPFVTVILGASLIEHELEGIIRPRFLRSDDDTWNQLTDENGPIGTFYQKILLAHALGVIDETTKRNSLILKNIRNAFAHARYVLDFDNPLIIQEMQKIVLPQNGRTKEASRLKSAKITYVGQRKSFIFLFTAILSKILDVTSKRTRARIRYSKQKSAKWRSENLALAGLFDTLYRQPEPQAKHKGSSLAHQNDDPNQLAPLPKELGVLAALPKASHNKGKKAGRS